MVYFYDPHPFYRHIEKGQIDIFTLTTEVNPRMNVIREVTMHDIARELGLSTSTISRGLKDHPTISKKTRKKIQSTAKALGYRHNTFASNLRKQKTNTIGVMVHELNSNFMISVLAGIEKITSESGYDMIIVHSSEKFEKEVANASNLFHKRVDGLIASLAFDTNNLDHYRQFREKNIPVVFFDRVEERDDHSKVLIDNYKCGYEATKHLVDQGCKRIVLVTANLNRNVYAQRHSGYKDALLDSGIKYDDRFVLIKDLSEKCGIEAAMYILKMNPWPDGLFITNDFSAAVCMQKLKEQGVRIPEDIAIVGFNNDSVCEVVEPPLTTINYSGLTIGETAARMILDYLRGSTDIANTKTVLISSELVVRQSSLRLPPSSSRTRK